MKWLGFEAMRVVNVRLYQAAMLLRYGHAAEGFLEALEAGKDVSDFHLLFAQRKPRRDKDGCFARPRSLISSQISPRTAPALSTSSVPRC